MRNILLVAVLGVVGACGGNPPPSCQDAIGHYYTAGCAYYDLSSGSAVQLSLAAADNACLQAEEAAPTNCQDALDAWLNCNADVPAPATSAQCDCSMQLQAVQTCK